MKIEKGKEQQKIQGNHNSRYRSLKRRKTMTKMRKEALILIATHLMIL